MTVEAFAFFQVAKPQDLWLAGTSSVTGGFITLVFKKGAYLKLNFGLSVNLFRFKVAEVRGDITRETVEALVARPAIFIPSFAGIASEEERKTQQRIQSLISKGHLNEVVRNMLLDLGPQTNTFLKLKERLKQHFQIEDLSVSFDPQKDEFIKAHYKVTRNGRTYWLDVSSLGLGTLQMLQMMALATQQSPWLILLDEPDSHMHASLQGRVVDLLREIATESNIRIIAATHSKDMMNRVSPQQLLRLTGSKLSPIVSGAEQRALLELLGFDNFDLASMFENTRLVVVEGKTDKAMFTALLRKMGVENKPYYHLMTFHAAGDRGRVLEFDPSPLHAFLNVKPIAVFDRDYFHPERQKEDALALQSKGMEVYPLSRKELENYFLLPDYISECIKAVKPGYSITPQQVRGWIDESCELQRSEVARGIHVAYTMYPPEELIDPKNRQRTMARCYEAADADLNIAWSLRNSRWATVSGKECFKYINQQLSANKHPGIHIDRLLEHIPVSELHSDVTAILEAIEALVDKGLD